MTNGSFPAGWYQDPSGQGDARYWNGVSWTESVDRGGVTVNVPIDPSQAQVPPVPGTQVSVPRPVAGTQTVNVSSPSRSPMGAILGVLFVGFAIVLIFAIVSNNDSSDDSPTPGSTPAAPATEAPAAPSTDGG
jgi:hypothetical protein